MTDFDKALDVFKDAFANLLIAHDKSEEDNSRKISAALMTIVIALAVRTGTPEEYVNSLCECSLGMINKLSNTVIN